MWAKDTWMAKQYIKIENLDLIKAALEALKQAD